MGVRFPSAALVTAVAVTITTTTETVILTTPPLNPPLDNAPVFFNWYFDLTQGTAGTAFTARVRRGSGITGAIIFGSLAIPLAAGVIGFHSGFCVDNGALALGGAVYSLTVQATAATGNGTVQTGEFLAWIL